MKHRVLIVEDDPDWSIFFQTIFSQSVNFEATAVACNLRAAQLALRRYRFDAALIDIGLPDGTGLDVLANLARSQPDVEAAICTIFEDEETVVAAVRQGASGYILKESAADSLIEMMSQMMAGGAPLSPKIARYILKFVMPAPEAPSEPVTLTEREMDVLVSIAEGNTLRQAGRSLGVAESTIRTHVKRIYSKLNVNSRGAALLEATRRQIL
ncbi:response regulator [Natronohydrobacter thiooxidans]|uniref:response regulator n=1 Tax=Natronohydrobacter thiooxidans TaxID=87172 RepID=UPI0008FF44C8|nr:response regulator transcription factor [Natronohydrobacter thiooxidans]